jgi:hypothetical protein
MAVLSAWLQKSTACVVLYKELLLIRAAAG